MKNNSIGIYGGSFNPFHKGHEYVIYNSKKELGLDKYYIIPNYKNPLKNKISKDPIHETLKKLRLETLDLNVKVSPIEFSIKSQNTYQLLTRIQKKCHLKNFVLIIGLDQLWELDKWVNFEWIVNNISICIVHRPGYDKNIEKSYIYYKFSKYFMNTLEKFLTSSSPNLFFLNIEGLEISSTDIRNRLDR